MESTEQCVVMTAKDGTIEMPWSFVMSWGSPLMVSSSHIQWSYCIDRGIVHNIDVHKVPL